MLFTWHSTCYPKKPSWSASTLKRDCMRWPSCGKLKISVESAKITEWNGTLSSRVKSWVRRHCCATSRSYARRGGLQVMRDASSQRVMLAMGWAWWRTTCWVVWHQKKLSRWRSSFTIIVVKTWRRGLPRVDFARYLWQWSRTRISIGLAVPSRNVVRNYWWNALGMTFNFFSWSMCGPFEVPYLDGMEVTSIFAPSSRRRRTLLTRTSFAIPLPLQCRSCRTTCIHWRIRSCNSPSMEWSQLQQWTFCKAPHGCSASDAKLAYAKDLPGWSNSMELGLADSPSGSLCKGSATCNRDIKRDESSFVLAKRPRKLWYRSNVCGMVGNSILRVQWDLSSLVAALSWL